MTTANAPSHNETAVVVTLKGLAGIHERVQSRTMSAAKQGNDRLAPTVDELFAVALVAFPPAHVGLGREVAKKAVDALEVAARGFGSNHGDVDRTARSHWNGTCWTARISAVGSRRRIARSNY